MSSAYYLMAATRQAVPHIWDSWWFELMYTLQGKPDQHVIRISRSIHIWQPFTNPYEVEPVPTLRRNHGTQCSLGMTVVLGHLILPPSRQPWSRGEKGRPSSYTTTQFTGPISPACDQYVQYLCIGTNPSVLNQHRQGLQHWRCRIFTSLPPPFLTDDPPPSPNGPVRCQVKNLNKKPPK
jgi:hypothetical protein